MLIYLLAGVFVAGLLALWVLSRMYVVAQPNQWMLVLRNGKLVKCGVGISVFQGLNDKIVKFPSKVHKVPFAAQQVTTEMQGIEVSGIIIWSIFREGDGPLKAYKSIGTDIQQEEPASANQNLVEMANGIVRHKIANSTIDQILKNRQSVREDVKKELNKNINGWGVWLETVEITDVKILSNSLFENLQTEFRERQRQRAEIISMRVDSEMREKRMIQSLEFANKEAENETKKQIIRSNEQLKVNLEKQKNYELDQEIQRQKLVRDQELKRAQAEAKARLQELVNSNNHEIAIRDIEINLQRQQKEEELNRIDKQLEEDQLKESLANEALRAEAARANELRLAEMRKKMQEAVPFDVYALERVREIMCSLPLQEVKVFNFSNEGKNSSLGSAIQQVLSEFQLIKGEVPAT
jgi:hypothetical protein